jgi:tetratricopeptide (TPR) repeat protein
LSAAEQLLQENLSQMKGRPDKELRYGVSASILSSVLAAQGRVSEARTLYEVSLQILGKHIGERSVAYARDLNRGGQIALTAHNPGEAAAMFERVLREWGPPQGQFPDEFTKGTLGLIAARLEQGRAEEARGIAAAFLAQLSVSTQRGQLQEQEAQGRRLLGVALLRLGRSAEAESDLRRAVDLRQSLDDPDSPWLAQARIDLALCLLAQHRAQEARTLLEGAAAAQSRQSLLDSSYRRELRDAQARLATST